MPVKRTTLASAIWAWAITVLLPYQLVWVRSIIDPSKPYTSILGGRQIGKDFVLAFVVAFYLATTPGSEWVVMSATRHHAATFVEDVRRWLTGMEHIARSIKASFPTFPVNNEREICGSNGASVTAVAPRLHGVVGMRGSVIVNEYAIVPKAREIMQAALAQIQQAMAWGKTGKLVVVSNASFVGSDWESFLAERAELERKGKNKGWTMLTSRWSDARLQMLDKFGVREPWLLEACEEQGIELTPVQVTKDQVKWVPRDPHEVIKLLSEQILSDLNGNQAAFDQWFECVHCQPGGAFYDLSVLNEADYDDSEAPSGKWTASSEQIGGVDFGVVRDPTAVANLFAGRTGFYGQPTTEIQEPNGRKMRAGVVQVFRATRRRTVGITVDSSGVGQAYLSDLRDEYPDLNFQGFDASGGRKRTMHVWLRHLLSHKIVRLPRTDLDLRMQLSSIHGKTTHSGDEIIVTPRIKGKHCDRATAFAQAALGIKGLNDGTYAKKIPPLSGDQEVSFR